MTEATLNSQIHLFLLSGIFGIFLGVVYDIFKSLRILGFSKKYAVFILDIMFFLIGTILTFFLSISFNNGEIRAYIVISELLGMFAYKLTVGKLLIKALLRVIPIFSKLNCKINSKASSFCEILNKKRLSILSNMRIFLKKAKKT